MERFGQYEVVREIKSTPSFTAYVARKVGSERGAHFFIRVFHPAVSVEGEAEGSASIHGEVETLGRDYYLEHIQAVKLQKQASRGGASRYIAPVHEYGTDERGAWYATDYYERAAVSRLIVGRVPCDAADLYIVIASAVQGLLELKREAGRTHGNLTSEHILLGGKPGRRVRDAQVRITEPVPGQVDSPAKLELADLRSLAIIIFGLVRYREVTELDQYSLGTPEEWERRLGKQGKGWYDLCQVLLTPSLTLQQFDLEQLRQRLQNLKPPAATGPALIAVGVIGSVVIIAAVAIIIFWPHKKGQLIIEVTNTESEVEVFDTGNEKVGSTPFTNQLASGSYAYTLKADGYEDLPIKVEMGPQETKTVTTSLIERVARVQLESEPLGADIYLVTGNSRTYLATTPTNLTLKVDRYNLVARYRDLPEKRIPISLVRGENKPIRFLFPYSLLSFTSDPMSADIYLYDNTKPVGRTPTTLPVAQGHLEYRLVKGDLGYSNSVEIGDNPEPVRGTLTQQLGSLTLKADAPVWHAEWSGPVSGSTDVPVTTNLPMGLYTVVVTGSNRETRALNIPIGWNSATNVTLSLPIVGEKLASLAVSSDPSGAQIFWQGVNLGPAPLTTNLPVATGDLVGHYPGLLDQTRHVELAAEQTTDVSVVFVYGGVHLTSLPSGANVTVDGKPVGQTPWRTNIWPAGEVIFALTKDNYNGTVTGTVVQSEPWEREVTLEKPQGSLVLKSDPPGAEVLLDGASLGRIQTFSTNLAEGSYSFTATYPGLTQQSVNVVVTPGQQQQVVAFRFPYGKVHLTSQPTGADVLLDGQKVGSTPYDSDALAPGQVNFVVAMGQRHKEASVQVRTDESETNDVVLPESTGTLALQSDPSGAEVFLEGASLGHAPVTTNLTVGTYEVSARDPDLGEQKEQLEVKTDVRTEHTFEFPYGSVYLTSDPSGARVYVGNQLLGTTPYASNHVAIGQVKYELKTDTLVSNVTVTVESHKDWTNNVSLTQARYGDVMVVSDPPGAEVWLDGKRLNVTPWTLHLPAGTTNLTLKIPELGAERAIALTVDAESPVIRTERFEYGQVVLDSKPEGADVMTNGTRAGSTPYTNLVVRTGPGTWQLTHDDYYLPTNVEVVVADHATSAALVTLTRGTGTLVLTSNVAGATATLSNTAVGTLTLPTSLSVPAGYPYTVGAEYRGQTTNIVRSVRRGQTETVVFSFYEPRTWTNSFGMPFVLLPAGYWVSTKDVTPEQYKSVMGRANSGSDYYPACDCVTFSYANATDFATKLNELKDPGLPSDCSTWKFAVPKTDQWPVSINVAEDMGVTILTAPVMGEWCVDRPSGKPAFASYIKRKNSIVTELAQNPDMSQVTVRLVLAPP